MKIHKFLPSEIEINFDEIESEESSFDVLYGNSPMDMLYRSLSNEELVELSRSIKSNPDLNELLIGKFWEFLDTSNSNDLLYVGKLMNYLAVLSLTGTEASAVAIKEYEYKLTNDSLLLEVVEKSYQDCIDKVVTKSLSDIEEEGLTFFKTNLNITNRTVKINDSTSDYEDSLITDRSTKKNSNENLQII